jgi:8-oxo-dGTP pyrophosphatase MutT (NUDIX family)
LHAPPEGPGWNLEELEGLLPDGGTLREAAVLVGLVPRDSSLNVLLTRRTDALRHHAGQVSFPGGMLESDDADPAAAAIREAQEEIGLVPAQIQPWGYLDPLATITGFRVMPLVGLIAPDYAPRPDPREVAEVFEVPLAFLMASANLQPRPIDHGGRPRTVLEYVNTDVTTQRIWGATASILFNLRERLAARAG